MSVLAEAAAAATWFGHLAWTRGGHSSACFREAYDGLMTPDDSLRMPWVSCRGERWRRHRGPPTAFRAG